MTATLYVVATPLGNLGDLSPRAADLLRRVPVVAAEDTRRTRGLFSHLGASPTLLSFHAHSGERRLDAVLGILRDGRDVALVSDAGTPGVSDPGRTWWRRRAPPASPSFPSRDPRLSRPRSPRPGSRRTDTSSWVSFPAKGESGPGS